ncbi:hypothetical protein L910_1991 [Vibrio fluvialis PG41]|uniref:Uncharacterized protein n=1 Tax=Vibrio fluvialis PG41 TaxID=1336752 RepID=S7HXW1_VIBFL|nr:hypothetical protein L910_1991 [Vibrio fluvialis PG41]
MTEIYKIGYVLINEKPTVMTIFAICSNNVDIIFIKPKMFIE